MKNVILFLFVLAGTQATAEVQNRSSTKLTANVERSVLSNISTNIDLYQSSNLINDESAESLNLTILALSINKTLASESKLGLSAELSYDNNGFNDTTLSNLTLSYSFKNIDLNRDNSLGLSARAVLPTNQEDFEDDSFRGAGSLRVSLFTNKSLWDRPLSLVTYVDGLKYTHKFQTNADGGENMSYRARVLAGANLGLSARWSIDVSGFYQAGETYQGSLKTAFFTAEEIQFTPKKDGAQFYLAHTNDGNALEADGESSNVTLFNKYTSVYSAGVRASF